MKIAIITPQLSMGGAEKMVYNLARGLKECGDEVTVMASAGYYTAKLREAGIPVITLPLAAKGIGLKLRVGRALGYWLKEGAYDVIHVQTAPLAVFVRLLQRRYQIPSRTVLTLHGSPEWKLKLFRPLLRVLNVERCAVSKRLAHLIQGRYIPNAVDPDFRDPEQFMAKRRNHTNLHKAAKHNATNQNTTNRSAIKHVEYYAANHHDVRRHNKGYNEEKQKKLKPSLKFSPLKVLIVARLVPEKGLDMWLEAVTVLKEQGITVETTFVGDGPERGKLEQMASENDLRTRFLGWRSDPWAFSPETDLFILPSRREGEPLALLEALAAGLPVVATQVGGIPDILSGCGILVEPTVAGLVHGVQTYLQQTDEERERLRKKAKVFVHARSWRVCVKAYREVYREAQHGTATHRLF